MYDSDSFQLNNDDLIQQRNAGNDLNLNIESDKQRIAQGTEIFKKELFEKWDLEHANAQIFPDSIVAVHPDVVDFLLNFNLISVYDNIAKQNNLDEKGRNILPRIVWKIAQTKKWESLDEILESELPLMHSVHVNVVSLLKQNILDKAKALTESPVKEKIEKDVIVRKEIELSLIKALNDYSKIGEQSVTSSELKLRSFPDPVRPSIKNWIADFHDVLGGGKHSPIERGNYLFHSENGKKLSAEDRQKLGLIFKSLDEETPLTIDIKNEKIIFDLQVSSDQDQTNTQSSINNNRQTSASRPFAADSDIFERYAPKNVQPTSSVSDRVNSLEKFYAKYPENGVGPKAPVYQSEPNAQQVETERDKMQFAAHPKSFSPNFSFKIKDDQAAVAPVENNFANQTKNNFSPNFAGGNISFSSAQKFPAELEATQPEAPANTPFAQIEPAPTMPSKSPFAQASLYHIGPRKSIEPETDEIAQQQLFRQKNIVNLKQINNGDSTN